MPCFSIIPVDKYAFAACGNMQVFPIRCHAIRASFCRCITHFFVVSICIQAKCVNRHRPCIPYGRIHRRAYRNELWLTCKMICPGGRVIASEIGCHGQTSGFEASRICGRIVLRVYKIHAICASLHIKIRSSSNRLFLCHATAGCIQLFNLYPCRIRICKIKRSIIGTELYFISIVLGDFLLIQFFPRVLLTGI